MRPAALTPAAATGSRRLAWADAAKGVCIALVVLHHLVTKHYDLLLHGDGTVEAFWMGLTDALRPVRMPLFFLISGMFAAGAARRPWREVLQRRVATPYYLYVVWLGLHAVVFSFATALPMNRTQNLIELLGDLLVASTQLWYLYALALYFVLAKVLLPFHPRRVLLAAAGVSALTSVLPIEAANRESVVQHFVFFLAGVLFPSLARQVAELRAGHVTAVLAAGFAATLFVASAVGLSQSATTLVVAVTGVPLAIRLVVAASSRSWFAGPAAALGRRTLPVYVMHVPVLSLLHELVVPLLPQVPGTSAEVFLAVYPLVAAAAVTGACLLLHQLMLQCGLVFLFRLPPAPSR
jgi:uncharacterized membrane protein YcfT